MAYCIKCGAELSEETQYCPICGEQQFPDVPKETPVLPMKWYRFVVNFQLFAAALFSAANAVNLFTGRVFGITNQDGLKAIYRVYPGLEPIAVLSGILYLLAGGFALYVRKQLVEYKKDAPLLYIVSLGVNILPYLVFTIGESVITNNSIGDIPGFAAVIIVLAMIYANYVYFTKRKHLFIN